MNGENLDSAGRTKKAWKTFFACCVLGPPVGAIIFVLFGSISMIAHAEFRSFERLGGLLLLLAIGIPLSYLKGGIFAAITGIIYAVYGHRFGRVPFWLGVLAGVFTFAIAFGLFHLLVLASPPPPQPGYFEILLFVADPPMISNAVVHVGAALFCCWFIQRFWTAKAT